MDKSGDMLAPEKIFSTLLGNGNGCWETPNIWISIAAGLTDGNLELEGKEKQLSKS